MDEEQQPFDPPRKMRPASRLPGILLGLALVLLAGGVALWLRQRGQPPPQPVAAPVAAPAPVEAAPPPAAPAPVPVAPAATDADGVRAALEPISSHAPFRRWIADGDAVARWAAVVDAIGQDISPRKQLAFLRPRGRFSAVARGGKLYVAPAAYQRYNGFADVVDSVDARALARAYRELHGALESAYRALGYPGGSLDRATGQALRRILATKVPDGAPEVVEAGGTQYEFADPKLEARGEIEKHLLRLGPRNARIIQAKARQVEQALALPR